MRGSKRTADVQEIFKLLEPLGTGISRVNHYEKRDSLGQDSEYEGLTAGTWQKTWVSDKNGPEYGYPRSWRLNWKDYRKPKRVVEELVQSGGVSMDRGKKKI